PVREAAEARWEKRSVDNTSPCGTAVQLPSARDSDLSLQLSAHRFESFANSRVFRTPAPESRARAWAEARSAIRQFHRGKAYRHRRTETTYSGRYLKFSLEADDSNRSSHSLGGSEAAGRAGATSASGFQGSCRANG